MNQEVIARGARAKQILDMPEFKELLEQVKRDTFDEWAVAPETDVERLAALKSEMTGLNRFYQKVQSYVRDAVVEQHNAKNMPNS